MNEDPRSAYFRLLHILSIAVPNSAEKIIEEFEEFQASELDKLPEVTRKLMTEAIDASLIRLKRIEEKLERLRNSLLSKSVGEKR
jgi:hypothetical protein